MGCEESVRVFKAFCDERRMAILEMLCDGEKCACVMLEKMDISQSTLSYHMKILCDSGVVASRQEGKWTHYSLNPEGFRIAEEQLRQLASRCVHRQPDPCCGGEQTAALPINPIK